MRFIRKGGRIIPIKSTKKSVAMAEALSLSSSIKKIKSPIIKNNFKKKINELMAKVVS
jgi:hypothetical protein